MIMPLEMLSFPLPLVQPNFDSIFFSRAQCQQTAKSIRFDDKAIK
jgi:hypothetical protein